MLLFKLLFCFFFATNVYAGFDTQQLTFSVGMVNASYSENSSTLSNSGGTPLTLASGAASVLPVDVTWEFYQNKRYSYYTRVTAPLLTSGKDSYFSLGIGINVYFKSLSSRGVFYDQNTLIIIKPKIRYYWGVGVGSGYLVYTTEKAKKSDLLMDLGAQIGLIYYIDDKWGLRAETGYARAIGVATSSSIIRAFLGVTRDFN